MIPAFMIAGTALLSGCGDDSGDGAASTPRPTAVPPQATPIAGEATIGSADGSGEEHVFVSSTCADDVLAIATDRATLYAGLPCDRALPPDVTEPYEGVAVVIHIVPGPPQKVFMDLESGETVELTVDGVWIVPQ